MSLARGIALLLAIVVCLDWLVGPAPGEGAGPWRAQVVDAETGQPLEGVVVLAYWVRYVASPGGWAGGTFKGAAEVVTGPDGRFEIPARTFINLLPFVTQIRGPQFTIFKPGYGDWKIRMTEEEGKKWDEEEAKRQEEEFYAYDANSRLLSRPNIVIELPPLKTREERERFYGRLGWSSSVPPEYTQRMREAMDIERAYLLGRK